MNSTNSDSEPWQIIAEKKRAQREEALYSTVFVKVPSNLVPKDLPKLENGHQNVMSIPSQLLSSSELSITESSIPQLLSQLHRGHLSASDVTAAFIKRATIAQQLTNCLTEPLFTWAIQRAKELDEYLARKGKPVGPLHGLPVSIKDGFNIKGYDSSIGIASLCFKPATKNAPMVDLLLSLGAVVITKTNVPQTLASLDSINNVFGRTMNPYNRLCTAGGSSGGEGVLVAMRGSAIGIGTDIGGSIRIPAMCNGVYGFKPSNGRLPYGGQQMTGVEGMSRTSVQAVAGPIGRSMDDIDVFMKALLPAAAAFGADCIPTSKNYWSIPRNPSQHHHHNRSLLQGSGPNGEFTIGILRSDGNCQLLPPITNVINEVSQALRNLSLHLNIKVIELATPQAWTRAQSVMSKLMSVDGNSTMSALLTSTKEPLVPWMSTRFRVSQPAPLPRVAEIQAQRSAIEQSLNETLWHSTSSPDKLGRRKRTVDAVICPVAPHPVPAIDSYNAVGYTSSWVLVDYPAGSVPVRDIREEDLQIGKQFTAPVLGSWDERNRELWDEKSVDRKSVYLGTKLSVQVVTARLEDERLGLAMRIVEWAVRGMNENKKKRNKNAGGSRLEKARM